MIYLDDTCFNITANGLKHWTFKSETIKLFRQIVFFFLQVCIQCDFIIYSNDTFCTWRIVAVNIFGEKPRIFITGNIIPLSGTKEGKKESPKRAR